VTAVALAAVLVAVVLWVLTGSGLGRREPVRVAVPKPAIAANAEGVELAASGTLMAALRCLLSFEGVEVIDAAQIGDVRGMVGDVARAVSADEVLTLALEPSGPEEVFVTLRRIRAEDGGVLFAETFPVPTARESVLTLAGGVAAAVRRAYPRMEVREGTLDLEVRPRDYAEFVEIWQRLQAGRGAWAPELARLEAIGARAPRFLEAHLQVVTLAVNLFLDTRDPLYLRRAHAALGQAKIVAPGPSRMLFAESVLATAEGRLDRAEQALAELEQRNPTDPGLQAQRARIAEARGDLAGAIALRRQIAEGRPTWRNLLELADLELRSGEIEPARRHLEQSAALVPGNTWPKAKLGELELMYGDLRRAEEIYRGLVAAGPQRSDLTNLGLVRFLLGDYDGAVESYREALKIDPGHLTVLLNLADAELARGRMDEARALFQKTLATLAAREGLSPVERCLRAQCLVHLGKRQEGVEMALETLQEAPHDAEVTYQAAVVFALAREDTFALAMARKAREIGVQARWLTIPAFEPLRADPTFQALLNTTEGGRRPGR
jgi:serine/threonine-protein kinase